MASQNKKKKAKNSYMVNGGEKCDLRLKRIMYYTKRERNRLKKLPERNYKENHRRKLLWHYIS